MKRKHSYPCISWREERSCHICRQIADERSYWSEEEWDQYFKEQKEKENESTTIR